MSENATFQEIGDVLRRYESFAVLSHVRPDGDAIGSQIALGHALEGIGKSVRYLNEDGLPESLAFLPLSEKIEQPGEPLEVDVVIALDTASQPRLGAKCNEVVAGAKLWINIDHHKSNPGYGDLSHIDATSPATGQILYNLIVDQGLPFSEATRDSIYVAVSTDTGSFQYRGTTEATYRMAADLVARGLQVGEINEMIYDSQPYRRVELMRSLLNTLECSRDGKVVDWQLPRSEQVKLGLVPDDSEGMIDFIRAVRGVVVALFFEELEDGQIRVSMRSKDRAVDASEVCSQFGGGGHALAAGIRMAGPMAEAREKVLAAVRARVEAAAS
ncbi:MAG: DHH family phosphoesterase [Verrucomicrobiales bacterium]